MTRAERDARRGIRYVGAYAVNERDLFDNRRDWRGFRAAEIAGIVDVHWREDGYHVDWCRNERGQRAKAEALRLGLKAEEG